MIRKSRKSRQRAELSPPTRQVMRHLVITLTVSAALATVFTAWTPASLRPGELANQLAGAIEGTPGLQPSPEFLPGPLTELGELKIGIVAGHSGPHPDTGSLDPGAICPDGLMEVDVNQNIAELVQTYLEAAGLHVDLLQEWDEALNGYRAVALVSIHADSCFPINEFATGYKVTAAVDSVVPDKSQRLVACLVDRYGRTTGLRFHPGSITLDMTEYHTFREINNQTPAAVIEAGFMYLDRDILTKEPEKIARGIADGVLCYVNNEPADLNWEN